MTLASSADAKNRFLATLEIVRRELHVLEYSRRKLFSITINRSWVEHLEMDMDAAEQMEAFVSRFGRLQDTLGDKLLPRAMVIALERPGSMLDNLNLAERLEWIENATEWVQVRDLRNRLIHEYMTDAGRFSEDLCLAGEYVPQMRKIYDKFLALAQERFGISESELGEYLNLQTPQ